MPICTSAESADSGPPNRETNSSSERIGTPQFLCLFRLRRIRFPVVADEVRCLPRDAAGHGAALLFDVGFERAAVFEEVHIARDDEAQTFAGSVGLLLGGRRPPV